jgi:hypothetical protein
VKHDDPDYADRQLREAIKIASSGLDLAFLSDAQQNLVEALREQSRILKDAKYDKKSPDAVARATAHTMKALDMVTRLAEFSRGNPDSRPALQGDWLQGLTEEQLGQVQTWLEANAERVENTELHESETESRS